MTYDEAKRLMESARNPARGKPIANNTRLYYEGGLPYHVHGAPFTIRLYATNIITIHRDDGGALGSAYTLRTAGWNTATTLNRINRFSPARVYSERGTWYVDARPPNGLPKYPDFHALSREEYLRECERTRDAWREYRRWAVANRARFGDVLCVDGDGYPDPKTVALWRTVHEEEMAEREREKRERAEIRRVETRLRRRAVRAWREAGYVVPGRPRKDSGGIEWLAAHGYTPDQIV